jgi:sulfatase modifying factor 1
MRRLHVGALAVVAWALAAPVFADGRFHVVQDCPQCPKMTVVEPGSFEMGSDPSDRASDPGEYPRHRVAIAKRFAIAQTAVSVGAFAVFAAETGYESAGCWVQTEEGWRQDARASWRAPGYPQADDHPVVCVSWHDASAYTDWLSKRMGVRYRLPTEAEWEYAARAGSKTLNFWGDDDRLTCSYGNVNDITSKNKVAKFGVNCRDGFMFTAPVASFRPNPFGLYDVIGNAWQWTADCWLGNYDATPRDGRAAEASGPCERVLRGSSWTDTPGPVRIAAREHRRPDERLSIMGFRLARDAH